MADERTAGPRATETGRTTDRHRQDTTARLDFAAINTAALGCLPALLERWLPDGRQIGGEYQALNPKRADRHRGSFSVNLQTGRWGDFATGDRGGDVISLAAYLFDLRQGDAARELAAAVGVEVPRHG